MKTFLSLLVCGVLCVSLTGCEEPEAVPTAKPAQVQLGDEGQSPSCCPSEKAPGDTTGDTAGDTECGMECDADMNAIGDAKAECGDMEECGDCEDMADCEGKGDCSDMDKCDDTSECDDMSKCDGDKPAKKQID